MPRTSHLALVVALACTASGLSYAQTARQDGVQIVNVSTLQTEKRSGVAIGPFTPEMQEQAHAAINSNAELKQVLERHQVQMSNVLRIETASNGQHIVFVK